MKRTILFLSALCMGVMSIQSVTAHAAIPEEQSTLSAFQSVLTLGSVHIQVPTVIGVPLTPESRGHAQFFVSEIETGRFVPSYLHEKYEVTPEVVTAEIQEGNISPSHNMVDANLNSGITFPLTEEEEGEVTIILSTQNQILSSGLTLDLDRNVALPTSIEIKAYGTAGEQIVLARTALQGKRVAFIPTTAHVWAITLTYAQPLRIQELTLTQDTPERSVLREVRFLAQPGMSYSIYHNPDRPVSIPYAESGDLRSDTGVTRVSPEGDMLNPLYTPADTDGDGVRDVFDNCVSLTNTDQMDVDRNGRGDMCDDHDRDGILNSADNCKALPNTWQHDTDGDGIGDECDTEESRLTERLPWVPWIGMGTAALILIGLFILVARRHVPPAHESL